MLNFLDNISVKNQGVLALLMGIILILGSLGKLGVLQGILETILVAVGIVLLVWGLLKSDLIASVKKMLKSNSKK